MGIDSAYGVGSLKTGVCTSTTRPAVPFEGQTIYETDTDLTKVYNGTAFVNVSGVSAVDISRVNTSESTSSSSYVGLTTAQTVTMTTGTKALVIISYNATPPAATDVYASVAVSGATTIAASDTRNAGFQSVISGGYLQGASNAFSFTLTAGSNTFTMQFRTAGSSTDFKNRSMTVIAYS